MKRDLLPECLKSLDVSHLGKTKYVRKTPQSVRSALPQPNLPCYVYALEMKKIGSRSGKNSQSKSTFFGPLPSDSVFGFVSSVPLPTVGRLSLASYFSLMVGIEQSQTTGDPTNTRDIFIMQSTFDNSAPQGKPMCNCRVVEVAGLPRVDCIPNNYMLPCFSVFKEQEEFDVCIQDTKLSLKLTDNDLLLIQLFHRHVFEDILPVVRNIEFTPSRAPMPLLVLPLKRTGNSSEDYELDYKSLCPNIRQCPVIPVDESRQKFEFNESTFVNAVVMPWYRVDHHYAYCFLVEEICHNLTPSSAFPNSKFASYSQYYAHKYGLRIFNLEQPLLRVRQLTLTKDFFSLIPKLVVEEESARESTMNYVVPELLQIHVLSASQWMALHAIPVIFHRLESLLLAEEFRCTIMAGAFGVSAQVPDQPKWNRLQYDEKEELFQSDGGKESFSFREESLNENFYGVSPVLLLQALTTASANDGINLERLETIGDSYLKFAVTDFLYHKMGDQDEGKLTSARMKVISNSHLAELARNRKIQFFVETSRFDPCNWLPPCYTSNELFRLQNQPFLGEKYLADVVEALIGSHVVSLGSQKALKFMEWMGFEVITQPSDSLAFLLNDMHLKYEKQQMIASRCRRMELSRVERTLGYWFNDQRYLLEAFTPPSSIDKITQSYQRLEFLGDAVLDYMMMRFFFEHPKKFGPGILTDLRTALVNNTILASLVVKLGFHKHLSIPSTLSPIFDKFVALCKKNSIHCANFDLVYDNEFSDDGSGNFEAPKVLADVFESLVGAVFLDSDRDLAVVWKIFYKVMREIVEECCQKPPQSPMTELCIMFPLEKIVVSKRPRNLPTEVASVVVTVKGISFVGKARNYGLAKVVAAKRALKHFRDLLGSSGQ